MIFFCINDHVLGVEISKYLFNIRGVNFTKNYTNYVKYYSPLLNGKNVFFI